MWGGGGGGGQGAREGARGEGRRGKNNYVLSVCFLSSKAKPETFQLNMYEKVEFK